MEPRLKIRRIRTPPVASFGVSPLGSRTFMSPTAHPPSHAAPATAGEGARADARTGVERQRALSNSLLPRGRGPVYFFVICVIVMSSRLAPIRKPLIWLPFTVSSVLAMEPWIMSVLPSSVPTKS